MPIPNWVKYPQLVLLKYKIGDIILNWVFSSVSPLLAIFLLENISLRAPTFNLYNIVDENNLVEAPLPLNTKNT